MVRITIVHETRSSKNQTATFTGTNAMALGMEYIYNQQPIKILAVRIEHIAEPKPDITKEMQLKG